MYTDEKLIGIEGEKYDKIQANQDEGVCNEKIGDDPVGDCGGDVPGGNGLAGFHVLEADGCAGVYV